MNSRKQVIVIGAGFAGLNCAKKLAGRRDIDVLILDRRNHHLFQPLLYQVAMAGLSPAEISTPIRSVFSRAANVRVLMAEVTDIKVDQRKVVSDKGDYSYDYLVVACGAEHSYFGHGEGEDFAPGLKTIEQATEIRRRVLLAFERAEAESDADKQRQWLTFVVVGGGPTGVELAGALGEITRFTLTRDFRRIDPSIARVILIEAGQRVLAAFDESLSKKAKQDLENLGVHVWLGSRVSEVNAEGVRLGAEWVAAKTAIWAAGVKPSPLNQKLGGELDKGGRAIVTKGLHLPARPEVFVIGDQAHTPGDDGQPLPGLAPVAMQQGRFVAAAIRRNVKAASSPAASSVRATPHEFHYNDKGIMATIGRRKAVVQSGRLRMHGLIAWWMWLVIHIYYLIGFRNRLFVLWQWAYSYMTYRRGARLITERDWHLH